MNATVNSAGVVRQPCQHCGMIHATTCPKIKAIEYYQDGSTKRIEFHDLVPTVQGVYPINPNIATTTGRHP
jgi:hypothetical protein